MPSEIRPARELPRDVLWNLIGTIRHDLAARGEILPASWVDETVDSVMQGGGTAWFTGPRLEPVALAILWVREGRGYGHLHGLAGASSVPDLAELARRLPEGLPAAAARLDMGATGLSSAEELALGQKLQDDAHFSTLLRHSMVRPLTATDPPTAPRWPDGVEVSTVRKVSIEELTGLDWRAYHGTPDESLLSGTPEGNRELLENALAGLFGPYLDDASPTARGPDGRLWGFAVACQESLRSGVVLDIVVDPDARRRGLGEALLLRSLRGLLALGFPRARLWVTDGNRPARTLYEKVGFVPDVSTSIYRWARSPGAR